MFTLYWRWALLESVAHARGKHCTSSRDGRFDPVTSTRFESGQAGGDHLTP
jgi:hypothetical protein